MLKRISIENDLRDIIKGFPDDVLDKVTSIEYYTTGDKEKVITPSFERVNDIIVVAIPSQDLKTLPSGVLYRRATYQEEDELYPDLTYDLTIIDSMDIWIEADSSHSSSGEPYLTESDFKTINGQSIVGLGDIEIGGDVDEDEVNRIIDTKLIGYAKKSELPVIPSFKTINGQVITGTGNIVIEGGSGGGITMQDVESKLTEYALKSEIPSLTGYATQEWVSSQGFVTGHQDISGKMDKSSVWTGTETQWNLLSDEQKSTYTIALITD